MNFTDYTTTAEIRAALSISSTELPDVVINTPMVGQRLDLRLHDINANLEAKLEEVRALPGPLTVEQAKFLNCGKLLVTYCIAVDFLSTLPTLLVKDLTDGKAEFSRFNEAFKDTIEGVQSMYDTVKSRTLAWLAVLDGSAYAVAAADPLPITVAVPLAVDPVTGS